MITHTRIIAELREGDIIVYGMKREVVVSTALAKVGYAWIVTQRIDLKPIPLPVRELRALTDRVAIMEPPDDVRMLAQALQQVRLRLREEMGPDRVAKCKSIIDEALFNAGVI